MRCRPIFVGAILMLLVGCTADPIAQQTPSTPVTGPAGTPTGATGSPSPTPSRTTAPTTAKPTPRPTTPQPTTPKPTSRPSTPKPSSTGTPDPRWRFFTDDATAYRSDWFDGSHRVMIGYGCTTAPYYDADARCTRGRGFHHGIDVAMPCGTPVRAGVAGVVVDPSRPGRPGAAYGSTAFRLRVQTDAGQADILIGHARTVLVRPGERVRAGQVIARTGDRGAPDGCHLHFEQRRVDGGLSTATDPTALLGLRRS